jgi:hypothetical protein
MAYVIEGKIEGRCYECLGTLAPLGGFQQGPAGGDESDEIG